MNILPENLRTRVSRKSPLRRIIRRLLRQALASKFLALDEPATWEGSHRQHQSVMSALAAGGGTGRLRGKVAIITGAASGIGRAMAVLFAREGASMVVADLNDQAGHDTVSAIGSLGGTALYVRTDVTSDDSVQAMVARAVGAYHKVDILVNNAGVNVEGGLLTLPPEQWQRALDVNLTSMYRCSRAAVPEIVKAGRGAVIMLGSVQGIAGFWDSSAYAASKGGVLALTRQLARQFASQGVRVNALSPGTVLTPVFNQEAAERARMFGVVSDYVPAGFIGVAEDVAYAGLYLASDESSYVTGINLVIDGGMTMRGV